MAINSLFHTKNILLESTSTSLMQNNFQEVNKYVKLIFELKKSNTKPQLTKSSQDQGQLLSLKLYFPCILPINTGNLNTMEKKLFFHIFNKKPIFQFYRKVHKILYLVNPCQIFQLYIGTEISARKEELHLCSHCEHFNASEALETSLLSTNEPHIQQVQFGQYQLPSGSSYSTKQKIQGL